MDASEIFSVGGPFVAFATIVILFLRLYFDRRDAKKPEKKSDNGVIETVRLTLEIARSEMADMNLRYRECEAEAARLRKDNSALREQLRWHERSV
jgi:hypothetical protein